jgi:glutamine amidotransferase
MITIVNYGLGNIQALHHIFSRMNFPVIIATRPEDLANAEKLILPGVGAFDWAMQRLNDSGMRHILDDLVLRQHVPVLGICVGMQMMALNSEEGVLSGLGWIKAKVKRFESVSDDKKLQLPHMGWNDVEYTSTSTLFKGIDNPRFYFLHSYYFIPDDPSQSIARTNYGCDFTSAIGDRHILGVQFHPEKSHSWGIHLLNNFAKL